MKKCEVLSSENVLLEFVIDIRTIKFKLATSKRNTETDTHTWPVALCFSQFILKLTQLFLGRVLKTQKYVSPPKLTDMADIRL